MNDASSSHVIIAVITGTIALLLMALFGISFIFYYHQKRRINLKEKQNLTETYQRELLQSQLEIQNQTLQQIAQELHDNIGQLLTVAVMRLNSLEEEVREPTAQQAVQQTRDLIRTIIRDIRTMAKTLDQDTVQRFGLLASLTLELERIDRMGRIETQFNTTGEPYPLGQQAEIVLLRMVQESLNNALKHAKAHQLTIAVDYQPGTFSLTVTDNGQGFNTAEALARPFEQAGAGLSNLYRRAGLLGGTCTINSQEGTGTRVEIQLPRQTTV